MGTTQAGYKANGRYKVTWKPKRTLRVSRKWNTNRQVHRYQKVLKDSVHLDNDKHTNEADYFNENVNSGLQGP